ncbi:hypothetical protein LPJ53_001884 [Coemansia erecta]|uniref:Fork-head domain-containing protein n=1 Tax=Coemansia erecta TaxID=147472 RepID=A0A9W7Y342_9FUNG|nr:hypothetical protein LPJ53_001884 [Coemansia erecta]
MDKPHYPSPSDRDSGVQTTPTASAPVPVPPSLSTTNSGFSHPAAAPSRVQMQAHQFSGTNDFSALYSSSTSIQNLSQAQPPLQPPSLQVLPGHSAVNGHPGQRFSQQPFDMSSLSAPSQQTQKQQMSSQQPQTGFQAQQSQFQVYLPARSNTQVHQSPAQNSSGGGGASTHEEGSPPDPAASSSDPIISVNNSNICDIMLLLNGTISIRPGTSGKPPYSYATLITYAILQHPRRQMTLNEIYTWVITHYPYFNTAGSGWKNSIRHNLSLNKTFVRIPRPVNEPGKGAYWAVDSDVLGETIRNKNKPQIHKYQIQQDASLDAGPSMSGSTLGMNSSDPAGTAAAAVAAAAAAAAASGFPAGFPQYPLMSADQPGFTSPGNSLMMGMTSSISDFGMFPRMASFSSSGGMQVPRRASLQIPPTAHRYHPYSMIGAPSLGAAAAAGVQSTSPMAPPPLPRQQAQLQSQSQAPQSSMFVSINPFVSSVVPAGSGLPANAPGSLAIGQGSSSAQTMSHVHQPPRPPPGIPHLNISALDTAAAAAAAVVTRADSKSQSTTPVIAKSGQPNQPMANPLSLHTHLQVKPTPSLPEYLLAPHQTLTHPQQKQFMTASPESRLAEKHSGLVDDTIAGSVEHMMKRRKVEQPGTAEQLGSNPIVDIDTVTSGINDIATYFSFGEASGVGQSSLQPQPPPQAQPLSHSQPPSLQQQQQQPEQYYQYRPPTSSSH